MKPRVCVSLLPSSDKEAIELVQRADRKDPDFIELRTDKLREFRILPRVRSLTASQLIATDRSKRDVGPRMMLEAVRAGYEYVDIDSAKAYANKLGSLARRSGARIIVSTHALGLNPSRSVLSRIIQTQRRLRPDVSKIVTGAVRVSDNLPLLDFIERQSRKTRLVAFAAGSMGRLSRIYSPFFGAFFTIAALEGGRQTGAGQLTIDQLRQAWRFLQG
jgi:3-dehydroquinate dehydratase type I